MTSASKREDLRACALAYARQGWPVFPLREQAKEPLTKQGFKDAVYISDPTTTIQQAHDIVLAWWSQWPDANIGIATGLVFDVLDIDSDDAGRQLQHWIEERDGSFYRHAGPVSRTGKGLHLLFAPTGYGNRAKLLDAPVDFRGKGGYIVAPPSIHPLGHRYRWDEETHRTEATALPEAPGWLKELVGGDPVRVPVQPVAIIRDHGPDKLAPMEVTRAGLIAMSRPDIYDVATRLGMNLRYKTGYALTNCPFHDDSDPSFALYEHNNTFYCYGCHATGDSHQLADRRDMHGKTFI